MKTTGFVFVSLHRQPAGNLSVAPKRFGCDLNPLFWRIDMKATKFLLAGLTTATSLSCVSARAAYILVDDFESRTLGDINGQGGWTAPGNYDVVADASGGSTQAMLMGASGSNGTIATTDSDFTDIASGTVATVFFRVRTDETAVGNFRFGPHDAAGGDPKASPNFGDMKVLAPDSGSTILDYAADGLTDSTAMWYSYWLVIDNTAGGTDTLDIYVQREDGSSSQIQVGDDLDFKGSDASGALTRFNAFRWNRGTALIDDIYVDTAGVNLANPIPEPSSLALLGLGGLLVARRRRG